MLGCWAPLRGAYRCYKAAHIYVASVISVHERLRGQKRRAKRHRDTRGQEPLGAMQALSGITSRLDKVQSFLDDKIADTPLAVHEDDAAQRKEAEAAVAARRRLAATKSADAVKDELLGAVQDDDDDDDLETDALKAENARLRREVRSLTTDLEAAERDGNTYRNDARDARKKLAALKRAQDDDDDSTKKAEASLKRDLADAQAGAAKASEIAKAARDAELKLQTALDEERRKAAQLT